MFIDCSHVVEMRNMIIVCYHE